MKLFTILALSVFASVAIAGAEVFEEIAVKIQTAINQETGTFNDGAYDTLIEAHSMIAGADVTSDQELAVLASMNSMVTYNLACLDALSGNSDEALTWLEEAVETGYSDADWMLQDQDLATLRENPRFLEISLVAAMNKVEVEDTHSCGTCPNSGNCAEEVLEEAVEAE